MPTASDPTLITIGADNDAGTGDVAFDPAGAPAMVAGLAQYYQRLGRLLTTDQVLGSPGRGAGLGRYIGHPFTTQLEIQALADAQATILADALTASIATLAVSMPTQGQIQLSADIFLVGQPAGSPPVALVWTVSTSS